MTAVRKASSGATLEYDAPKAYKLHMLEKGPSTHVSCNKEEGLDIYKKMQVVRRMEASANNMYKSKLIRGFCHLYSGQVRSSKSIDHDGFFFFLGSRLCWDESSYGQK